MTEWRRLELLKEERDALARQVEDLEDELAIVRLRCRHLEEELDALREERA